MTKPSLVIRTPPWGTAEDRRSGAIAVLGAAAMTAVYVALSRQLTDYSPTGLEILGTTASLSCTWLIRRQNVLSMPLGIIGVVAMGIFFFQIDLVGQGWLYLGYYIPAQALGWWVWIRSGEDRTDKPVAWMSGVSRVLVVLAIVGGTVLLAQIFGALHGPSDTLLWDSSIVSASIAAQALVTIKRAENWWLWLLPVDASALVLYVVSGAYLFAALYGVYLVIGLLGLRAWSRAWHAQGQGLTALEARLASA